MDSKLLSIVSWMVLFAIVLFFDAHASAVGTDAAGTAKSPPQLDSANFNEPELPSPVVPKLPQQKPTESPSGGTVTPQATPQQNVTGEPQKYTDQNKAKEDEPTQRFSPEASALKIVFGIVLLLTVMMISLGAWQCCAWIRLNTLRKKKPTEDALHEMEGKTHQAIRDLRQMCQRLVDDGTTNIVNKFKPVLERMVKDNNENSRKMEAIQKELSDNDSRIEDACSRGRDRLSSEGKADVKALNNSISALGDQLRKGHEALSKELKASIASINLYLLSQLNAKIAVARRNADDTLKAALGNQEVDNLLASVPALQEFCELAKQVIQGTPGLDNFAGEFGRFTASLEEGDRAQLLKLGQVAENLRLLNSIGSQLTSADGSGNLSDKSKGIEDAIAKIDMNIPKGSGDDALEARQTWDGIENDLINVLQLFYTVYYDNRIPAATESRIAQSLKKLNICPIPIVLNETKLNPTWHEARGNTQGPPNVEPLAIVRVLEAGFYRASNQQPIRKAAVITNTRG